MSFFSAFRSRTIAVLALLCLALALVAVGELDASTSSPSSKSTAPSPETVVNGGVAAAFSPPPPFSLPPLQSFASVTDRPLFSPSRQPGKVASGESDAWSSFVLAGIIITPQLSEALVLHNQPQTLVHIEEGEALDGWTLQTIFPDHAVFRNGAEEHELKLNVVASGKTPVVPRPRNPSIGQPPLPPPQG